MGYITGLRGNKFKASKVKKEIAQFEVTKEKRNTFLARILFIFYAIQSENIFSVCTKYT